MFGKSWEGGRVAAILYALFFLSHLVRGRGRDRASSPGSWTWFPSIRVHYVRAVDNHFSYGLTCQLYCMLKAWNKWELEIGRDMSGIVKGTINWVCGKWDGLWTYKFQKLDLGCICFNFWKKWFWNLNFIYSRKRWKLIFFRSYYFQLLQKSWKQIFLRI